jgi:hypothetical protein
VATRERPDGIVFDDDRSRVDVDAVHRFLSEESYWAQGRTRETVERLLADATRVVAGYDGGRQIAFARCFSDGVSLSWIGDVYVEGTHRGRRVGEDLVRFLVDGSDFPDIRWMLATRDAHTFYARLGFGEPGPFICERPAQRPPVPPVPPVPPR